MVFILTMISVAGQPEECKSCHSGTYDIWNASVHAGSEAETTIEPITCEACHAPPAGGYDVHIGSPFGNVPEVSLSAEVCGTCHRGDSHPVIEEWDEFGKEGFNITDTMSHSEPADIGEPFILEMDNSCVSCKSTDGAIPNLADEDVYGLNLAEVPEASDVSEWSITCVACHDPHSAGCRIEDEVLLCANCHNSQDASPDGMTISVSYTNWEMYNGSIYYTGVHPVSIGCSDCHMATREFNDTTGEAAITGHTFDFEPELLFSPDSSNGCYDCHKEFFTPVLEAKQGIVAERLDNLEALRTNATESLERFNGTSEYDSVLADYNNAVFYMEAVKGDGSYGIHNKERTYEYLDNSRILFNSVIERQPTPAQPGFEAILAVAGTISALMFMRRRRE
ncbi:PGF-CTERM sorting domain-containing protein [Methanolobus sp. WCC4]|uniref:PGF-CTERM sorting domain-containing protein n=1 Tax=Methanolobus sp. WCC4 TaxID=3125784 RepID=UPI0030F9F230